ncbi:putative type IX secretion system sortase PorU2 [Anditalea andensis]|uniref:Transporter n=1 Tax=Anditalea andensis TaxID=1048983 RepID=A0A074LMN5_9BACT|nr:C25 family cysteine peptidase [Anditalea andensis]KEO75132.1 transporter [Anditalea andensis]
MKKYCIWLFIIVDFLVFEAVAQHEWIDFSNSYYRITTAEDGVYRVGYATLSVSGIDVTTIDPRDIRLYHRGKEVPIYAYGQEDGRFDPEDYIEFVGKKNDATLDYDLYKNSEDLPNPYFNTHSDTTAYYLTVNPGVRGLRMSTVDFVSPALPGASVFHAESLMVFSDQYHLGQMYDLGVRLPIYDKGQGWMGPVISKGNQRDFVFTSLGMVMNSGAFSVDIGLVGRAGATHTTAILAGPRVGTMRQIEVASYGEYDVKKISLKLQYADFNGDGSIIIRVRSLGNETTTDNISVSFIKIHYPSKVTNGDFLKKVISYNLQGNDFEIPDIHAVYAGYDITDYDMPKRLDLSVEGGVLRLPGGSGNGQARIILQQAQSITQISNIQKVRFRDILNQPASYVFITHESLRKASARYRDPVGAYAAYRKSTEGGSFDTLVVNMDQLYDQFSYGEKTPLAIYNFIKAYYLRYQPEYLLLVGRALGILSSVRQNNVSLNYRHHPTAFPFQELVPSAGYPYSDAAFVHGLDTEFPELESLPLGRIPARTPDEVEAYLNKIKEKDAMGVKEEWQKNLIHLSGGLSALELNRYYIFMNGFKDIAEEVYMGGHVKTFRKRSNATVELIDISKEINQGASLVTFFGHAAPSLIDIEIGFASDPQMDYINKGKYPVLLLNGCDAGNAFGTAYTFGEDWVLTPDKGASHFIAHTNVGVDVILRRYSENFYLKAFADSSMIHQSIGKVRRAAEQEFYRRYGTDPLYTSLPSMMVMLGDPAGKIFPAPHADYEIKSTDVTLEGPNGEVLNAFLDTLHLKMVVRNLGKVNLDSFDISVSRRLPDGVSIDYENKRFRPVYRRDTIIFTIPNRAVNAYGENTFTIEINKDKNIQELNYFNNSITTSHFIQMNGVFNLFPLNFSIVPNTKVDLISQTSGTDAESSVLWIQVDTTHQFSSAARKEIQITSNGLTTWSLDYSDIVGLKDTVTIYWRTKILEPKEGEAEAWSVSSFSYIKNGSEGWTQRELSQFIENTKHQLFQDLVKNEWKFESLGMDLDIFTFGRSAPSLTYQNTQLLMDGIPYILNNVNNVNSRMCPNGSLGLLSFQKKDLTPYLVFPPDGFDVLDGNTCGRVPQIIQSIRNTAILNNTQYLIDYVNGVGEGDYVLIFSVGNVNFSNWPDIAYQKLTEFGANESTLRKLKTGDPYILFGKKGMKAGEAIEMVADSELPEPTDRQVLQFNTRLEGHFTSGSIISPMIGPASEWKEFFSYLIKKDVFNNNNLGQMDIIGIARDGNETLLVENARPEHFSLEFINSIQYPYIRLRYAMDDPEAELPGQLMKWQVNYTGVPEGVLIYNQAERAIQLREGEERGFKFEFANISPHDFTDSLVIEWIWRNRDKSKADRFFKKIAPVPAGKSTEFLIGFNSIGMSGLNNLHVFANPRIALEQTYQNNIIDIKEYVSVLPAEHNPVLDVHFDGIYIMDGDLVSPTVMISAVLRDAGSLIRKKDTVGVEIAIRSNCVTCIYKRVYFNEPKLKWYPATDTQDFKVEFQPGPLEDGKYSLMITATDASGNKASDKPYEITFEVVNDSQITHFYPYPNPFSSSVRFVFTVTGSQVPDQIKIQIMTVTGKVVREIFQDELGPIRIGHNLSDYAWDGRDEFGGQLANGVYIYRVLVLKNGHFMEHRSTAGDKAFKKGYGKMYLLR